MTTIDHFIGPIAILRVFGKTEIIFRQNCCYFRIAQICCQKSCRKKCKWKIELLLKNKKKKLGKWVRKLIYFASDPLIKKVQGVFSFLVCLISTYSTT